MTEDSTQKNLLKNYPHLKQIIKQAQHFPALPVTVVNAEESHVLEGIMEARQQGLVDPVLIGDADMIRSPPHLIWW